MFMAACVTLSAYGDSISELNQQRDDIQDKLSNAKDNLSETQSQKQDTVTEIALLDRELSECQAELDAIINDLEVTTKRMDLTQEELEKAIFQKEEQYETLKKRIRVMYENGDIGYLEIILESDSFSDFLDRIEYSNRLMEFDDQVLTDYQHVEETIDNSLKQIEQDKAELEDLEDKQEQEKKQLNENIAEKNKLVEQLNSNEATYKEQIEDLEAQDADIEAMIKQKQKEEAQRAAAAKASRSSGSSGRSSGGSSGSSGAVYQSSSTVYESNGANFMYPVPAYSGCTPNSGYGYRSSPISGGSEFHTGLDLKATLNTDVVAAESGTVIYSGVKGGYGNCVIIDHGGGISTLYAHNNILCCNVGDTVSKGQVISKAGTTGYSTGVHLHFEVRINGSHTNPTPYIY